MRTRTQLLLGLIVASSARIGEAQSPSGVRAADPAPSATRAEEVWGPAPEGSDVLRRLKHILLANRDRAWLTLGGSVRLRGSDTRNYLFSPAATSQDEFTELRTLLSADLWIGERSRWHVRGFAEWRDAQGFGRTLPGGVRTNEADRADWQSHFGEVGFGKHGLRVGRQDVGFGRERTLGYSDWSNSRRSFEGTRLVGATRRYQWDLFKGRVMTIRTDEPNQPDSASRLVYGALTMTGLQAIGKEWRIAGSQLYALVVDQDAAQSSRRTGGGRIWWDRRTARRDWTAELEGALQRGGVGTRDVQAWFAVGEATVAWREVAFTPSATAGVEIASGMGADAATRVRAFVPPYPTSHSHNGLADVFGRTNLRELRLGGGARPHKSVQLLALARRFDRVSLDDGAYTKSSTILRAGPSRARALGSELDVTAQWTPSARVRVLGGAAWVNAGDFIEQTGTSAPVRWAFISTVLAF